MILLLRTLSKEAVQASLRQKYKYHHRPLPLSPLAIFNLSHLRGYDQRGQTHTALYPGLHIDDSQTVTIRHLISITNPPSSLMKLSATSTGSPLSPEMSTTDMTFPLKALPRELQNQIWETTLGIGGSPIIQCLEIDMLQGIGDMFSSVPSIVRSGTPTLSPPTYHRGGRGTFNASHYLHVRNVAEADADARETLERFQRVLRLKPRKNILELKAKCQPGLSIDAVLGEVSVWLNTERDLLLLQSPSYIAERHIIQGALSPNWFHNRTWRWDYRSFWPLPFFGLDRIERLAIDWQAETTRRSIRRSCGRFHCEDFRMAYHIELYRTPRKDRRYCAECLARALEWVNKAVQDRKMKSYSVRTYLHFEFRLNQRISWTDKPLGFDEHGNFTCKLCNREFPSSEGRLREIVEGGPYDMSQLVGWQPECHGYHDPGMESDIETLLFGRMSSLKTFYVIDTSVRLKGPASEAALLCRPREVFEGHNCKFVEVDPREAAWDLNTKQFPRYHKKNNPCPFTSFHFADKLRRAAWRFACRQNAKAPMEEQRANGDPFYDGDLFDAPAGSAESKMPLQDRPLHSPVGESLLVRSQVMDLQYPNMRESASLMSEIPDYLLPIKVKVMTRIDPGEYWRLGPVTTAD